MIRAIIISAAAIAAAAGLGIYVLYLRRQLRDISRQIQFIEQHNSSKKITIDLQDKTLLTLVECINELADEGRRIKMQAQHNERTFKDTIAGISHDIRTPLTSLHGYFQMLQKSLTAPAADSGTVQKYLMIMGGRIDELQDMTEQLFTFVKLENPSYRLEQETVNLTQIICDVLFSFYNPIAEKGFTPMVNLPDDIIYVEGNTAALRRVLQNLTRNALLHGERDLWVSMTASEQMADIVVGNRIPDDASIDAGRVFDRFYKADASRHSGSTGLGLFIAKSLTERMGGSIRAQINENDDRLFFIMLSLNRTRQEPQHEYLDN